jgi:hypothetical protein
MALPLAQHWGAWRTDRAASWAPQLPPTHQGGRQTDLDGFPRQERDLDDATESKLITLSTMTWRSADCQRTCPSVSPSPIDRERAN